MKKTCPIYQSSVLQRRKLRMPPAQLHLSREEVEIKELFSPLVTSWTASGWCDSMNT